MRQTKNFKLNLPEDTDPLEVSKISENFETLDEAIEQKSRESGFQVGDLLQTTRSKLGEGWALCNGDILPPGDYPDFAKAVTDPVTMATQCMPLLSLSADSLNCSGYANGCIVEDRYITYLKNTSGVSMVTSVWVDVVRMEITTFDIATDGAVSLNTLRAFTVYNSDEKKVYYYNGTNLYSSSIKGPLSLVGALQYTIPTGNAIVFYRVLYKGRKYTMYIAQTSNNQIIVQSSYPTFQSYVTLGINNVYAENKRLNDYFLGKPNEFIFASTSTTFSNNMHYISENADGSYSQKIIPASALNQITQIEWNTNVYTPTSNQFYTLRNIKYCNGKYYIVYENYANYTLSGNTHTKHVIILASATSLSTSKFTTLYSMSYVEYKPGSGTSSYQPAYADATYRNKADRFNVSPVMLRDAIYFLPEYMGSLFSMVLKLNGSKADVVLDAFWDHKPPEVTSSSIALPDRMQWLAWGNIQHVGFRIWQQSISSHLTDLAIWPSLRVPLIPDEDIVRTVIKVK